MQRPRALPRKSAAALFAVLAHLLAISLLISTDRRVIPLQPVTIFVSVPVRQSFLAPPAPAVPTSLPAITVPPILLPGTDMPPGAVAPAARAPDALGDFFVLGAIGRHLPCTVSSYDGLPEEERARCAGALARQDAGAAYVPSLRQHQAQVVFSHELARKKAPFLVPCFAGLSLATILCLADVAINGFDADRLPGYATYPYDSDVGAPTPPYH